MKRDFRGLFVGLCAVILTVAAMGCERRCETCPPSAPSGPSTPTCSFEVAPLTQHFPYQGGSGSVVVRGHGGCSWTAVSNAPWVAVAAVGNETVAYSVQNNTGPYRTGTLTIAGQLFTVTQDAAPVAPPPQPPPPTPPPPPPAPSCTYAVQETPQQFTYKGGNGGFSVSASRADCGWNAVSQVGWIAVTGGSPGTGNGTVSYLVAGNAGPARTGTIAVAGKTVTIAQSAP